MTQFEKKQPVVLAGSFLKWLVDAGTTAISILTDIIDLFGVLPTVMAGVGLAAFVKNFD